MTQPATITLRPPQAPELDAINHLIMRSKAFWGYDAAFMAACRTELSLTPTDIAGDHAMLAVEDHTPLGIATISVDGAAGELEKLFVAPEAMGRGVGRHLMDWARTTAVEKGATALYIDADPGAEPFYQRMGAMRIGEAPSGSIAGRMLPRLRLPL
ncbi:MAG: GNAT family N-acetyltransferase [Pseudomonadota bacterium]